MAALKLLGTVAKWVLVSLGAVCIAIWIWALVTIPTSSNNKTPDPLPVRPVQSTPRTYEQSVQVVESTCRNLPPSNTDKDLQDMCFVVNQVGAERTVEMMKEYARSQP